MFYEKLQRAEILIDQGKYEGAERILQDLVKEAPGNAMVLGYYSVVSLNLNKNKRANELIKSAIKLAPTHDFFYYIEAQIALRFDKYDQAEKSLQTAIQLDPEEADYHAYYAFIKLDRKEYTVALENANHALSLDGENLMALNARARALNKLNDVEGAKQTIQDALQENPNNAYTHANFGWNLLEKGDKKKALTHFKEALKIDPNSDIARAGMVEALKAKYLLYRLFLKYTFWIGNLSQKYQWAVIIGFYVMTNFISSLARNNPALEPYLSPVIYSLAAIALSTWLIGPFSNLAFRLNKYGKHLLTKKERISSNFVGISLLFSIVSFAGYFVVKQNYLLSAGIFGLAMTLPLGSMLKATKPKYLLIICTAILAAIGLSAIGVTYLTGILETKVSTVFLFGFVAFQFAANFLMIKEDNI